MIDYREQSIRKLTSEQYQLVNGEMCQSEEFDNLCNKLAQVTRYTSFEWSATILCALADYTGNNGDI